MKATTVKRIFEYLGRRNDIENGLHINIDGVELFICGDTGWDVDIKDKLLYIESNTEKYFIDTDSITCIKEGG